MSLSDPDPFRRATLFATEALSLKAFRASLELRLEETYAKAIRAVRCVPSPSTPRVAAG
jgi:hypothetical protein